MGRWSGYRTRSPRCTYRSAARASPPPPIGRMAFACRRDASNRAFRPFQTPPRKSLCALPHAFDLFDQLLGFVELLEQAVDVLHGHARARGDTAAPAGVDDRRGGPVLRRPGVWYGRPP